MSVNLITKGVQICKGVWDSLPDLSFDGVVVVLGTLGEDVLNTTGLAHVKQTVPMEVMRLKEFDPEKIGQTKLKRLLDCFL